MDKRVRNAAIASVVIAALLILSMVLLLNGVKGGTFASGAPVAEVVASEDTEVITDEKSFLNDQAFLDEYQPFAGEVRGDDYPKLSLLVSSVERDIRVMVIDEDGAVVEGEKFYVTVEGIGEYKDLDADGYIYIAGIKPGSYYVSLNEIDGYDVPARVKVTVKDKIG